MSMSFQTESGYLKSILTEIVSLAHDLFGRYFLSYSFILYLYFFISDKAYLT